MPVQFAVENQAVQANLARNDAGGRTLMRIVRVVVLATTFETVAETMTDEQCHEAAARLRALDGDGAARAFYKRTAEALEAAASNRSRKGSED
jgi:hypothetical protein